MRTATAILVLTAGCAAPQRFRPDDVIVIDLTRELAPGIAIYPGGTHLDAPAHLIAGAASLDRIPAERLVAPGLVLDIRAKCAASPDYALTYIDIKEWEARHGRIPNGAILLLWTGWSERWADPRDYLNADADGVLHFPGVSVAAAEYLVKYRDLLGVGIDTLSIDHGPSKDFAAHKVLHADGIYHVENLTNLERVPPTGATIVVAPLPIVGGSGSPCRVLALAPRESESVRAPRGEKFLIEFGWDIPTAGTLADAAAAGTPFDGAVFDPEITAADGKTGRFSWTGFGAHVITERDIGRIVGELRRAPRAFRRRSFIRFNATPGRIDWFDDFSPILENARAAARIARQAGLAGILFDVEQYQEKIFDQRTRPAGRGFAQYAAQVRRRGEEFMRAVNAEHPALEILLTFGFPLAARDRARAEYGLLPAFLDGLTAARTSRTRIIDGYEFAYPFKARAAFERGREEILRESARRCAVGFGVWLDWNSGTRGWHVDDFSKNWFSPSEFENAVRDALDLSDRYVWIYTERLNWWTRENLPEPYLRALAKARRAREFTVFPEP